MFISGKLDEIVTGPAERRVMIHSRDGRFSVFDGYKGGRDGLARLASAEWMQGQEREVVLLATMGIELADYDDNEPPIEITGDETDDYHGHQFRGRVAKRSEDPSSILDSVYLFGDREEGERGVPLDVSPYEQPPVALLSIGSGSILVDLDDIEENEMEFLEEGAQVGVQATRTDLLGFTAEK